MVVLFQVIRPLPLVFTTFGAGYPVAVNTAEDVALYPCINVMLVGPVILGAAFTEIEKVFVTAPRLFEALTVKVNAPPTEGVPDRTPAVESVSPVGRVPEEMLQVMGVVPLAARV